MESALERSAGVEGSSEKGAGLCCKHTNSSSLSSLLLHRSTGVLFAIFVMPFSNVRGKNQIRKRANVAILELRKD